MAASTSNRPEIGDILIVIRELPLELGRRDRVSAGFLRR